MAILGNFLSKNQTTTLPQKESILHNLLNSNFLESVYLNHELLIRTTRDHHLVENSNLLYECVWSGHQFPVRHITISFKSCLVCKYWRDCEISGLCDEEAIV